MNHGLRSPFAQFIRSKMVERWEPWKIHLSRSTRFVLTPRNLFLHHCKQNTTILPVRSDPQVMGKFTSSHPKPKLRIMFHTAQLMGSTTGIPGNTKSSGMLLEAITINLFPGFGCQERLHKPSIWGVNCDSVHADKMERHRGVTYWLRRSLASLTATNK